MAKSSNEDFIIPIKISWGKKVLGNGTKTRVRIHSYDSNNPTCINNKGG